MASGFKLNLCSLNTRGLRNKSKLTKVLNWCSEKQFNAVFLQETFITNDNRLSFDSSVREYGKIFHSCPLYVI